MAKFVPVDPFELVIFGGTGDLAQRKLLPALFHRFLDGQIDSTTKLVGVARSDMKTKAYRAFAREACKRTLNDEDWDEAKWAEFAQYLDYVQMDATAKDADWAALKKLLPAKQGPRVFYLATAPRLYVSICEGLGAAKLVRKDARVVLEKPIGTNLETAAEINDGVAKVFAEDSVYRIDHYLGKETVQNLMVLRFANTLLEPIWSRSAIDHVQITVAESLGLEDRADYYDRSGALRDMVQNHLLQLLCLTAMEPPNSLENDDVRTEKIKVLRALKRFTPETAKTHTVRAQYKAGVYDGAPAKGYLEELSGESAGSETETFVAIKAEIENWRWAGTPFYLRTGKRMDERHSDIVIQFKPTPHALFGEAGRAPNRLVIRLQPDEGVRLFIQIKEPGPGGLRIKSLPLNLSYAESFMVRYPDAYERLLMEVVRGNLSLFMRRDEVEAAWRWVDALIDAWAEGDQTLETYTAGSDGPLSAAMLLDRDGRAWWERSQ
ncbi:MAG: glucose-6-phosphate dehydrogenase [Pseudomonadota bacterium]